MTAAHIDDLPAGLDWQAFQSRCFPERRRHDLKALASYSAYKRRPREIAARDEVTVTAFETWEDDGGSMAQVDDAPLSHEVRVPVPSLKPAYAK